jgi:hypothetical protein
LKPDARAKEIITFQKTRLALSNRTIVRSPYSPSLSFARASDTMKGE